MNVSEHLVVLLTDAQLEALAERVAAKLKTSGNGNGHHAPEEPDKLLDAKAAAERLGVTPRWIYSHDLSFAVRLPGSRAVRYSERGIAKYINKRQG